MPQAATMLADYVERQTTVISPPAEANARPLVKSWSRRIAEDLSNMVAAGWGVAVAGLLLVAAECDGLIRLAEAGALLVLLPTALTLSLLISICARDRKPVGLPHHPLFAGFAGAIAFATSAVLNAGTLHANTSPAALLFWVVAGAGATAASAWVVRAFMSRPSVAGRLRTNVAVYGASIEAKTVCASLSASATSNFVGLYEDRVSSGRVPEIGIVPEGGLDALVELVRQDLIDEIVITLPRTAVARNAAIAKRLQEFPVDVRICTGTDADYALGEAVVPQAVPLKAAPIRDWGIIMKMMEDRVIGTIGLICAAPIFLLIGIAIKLDSTGPVFFRQKRHGISGNPIVVWKFRTMRVMDDGAVVKQATKGDPRVTRVGRILRKTSLDELPQLINVVLGTMSLVGPRPHAIAHNEYYGEVINTYVGRNQVRPGITGWAQINGFRGETQNTEQMARRVDHDIWYIANWSFLLDLKIILLTPVYGLVHKNAY